jgi:ketosteroid isomerase-like protein
MSKENVERAYRAFEAINRRDLDAFLGLIDPEVEFTTRFIEMAGDPYYRGYDGIREWWEDLLGIFPDFRVETQEARDLGDLVIGAVHVRGRGVDSDAPFEETLWGVSEWRNGKVVWWQTFGSEAEALEAAGLRE